MTPRRDPAGRFAMKPRDELSPAYRRRIDRSKGTGKSLREARGHGTKAIKAWESREAAGRGAYDKVLDVLRRMRQGESLSRAARGARTTPDTVLRYGGSALTRNERGRYHAKLTDRLYRRMRFLDEQGERWVEPANSREASKLGEYWNAVDHYLATGDDKPLRRFRRMRLRTRQKTVLPFVTDLDLLDRLGRAGELSFESLYQLAA